MTCFPQITVQQIDALLPQTQCGKCGFDGCRPYAESIIKGEPFNQCPPGGQAGIESLARLLGQPTLPLNTTHGEYGPQLLARIREDECIGCTKCIQACPLDAILGAAKLMHTVIENQCSGCDLCVEPCPVDCIEMIPASGPAQADLWRLRYEFRQQRLALENQTELDMTSKNKPKSPPSKTNAQRTAFSRTAAQQDIADAVARVKARQAARSRSDNHQ